MNKSQNHAPISTSSEHALQSSIQENQYSYGKKKTHTPKKTPQTPAIELKASYNFLTEKIFLEVIIDNSLNFYKYLK